MSSVSLNRRPLKSTSCAIAEAKPTAANGSIPEVTGQRRECKEKSSRFPVVFEQVVHRCVGMEVFGRKAPRRLLKPSGLGLCSSMTRLQVYFLE